MFKQLYTEVQTRQEAIHIIRGLQLIEHTADVWFAMERMQEYLEKTTNALRAVPYAFGTDFFVLHDLYRE